MGGVGGGGMAFPFLLGFFRIFQLPLSEFPGSAPALLLKQNIYLFN